ncbi:MAG TPA: hypothetical protein VJ732_02030 [Bryobacteraceae bacterium]|nr:hypothetical protein [Bryobacteraceae bacterium]
MNNRQSRILAAAAAIAAVVLSAGTPALAQPPAQGPAQPSPNALTLEGSGITAILQNNINQGVAAANASLAANKNYHATISWSSDTWFPYMLQTQYKDRPNEFYVNKPFILTFDVSNISAKVAGVWVSYPFDRTISQSINVQIFCEGWQNGKGVLTYKAVFDPPYLDPDHSVLEDFLGLDFVPNYVDSKIQGALGSFPAGTQNTSTGQACYSLGVPTPAADAYEVDLQPTHRVVVATLPFSEMTVRILQVTRLTLHNRYGVVYEQVETPHLDFWAGWSRLHLDLPPMVEGQAYVPTTNAVLQTPVPPDSGQLVLIADMTYDGVSQEDSTFAVFGKSGNFGNGTQSIPTPKTWSEPPVNGGKPIFVTGNGYQLVVQIVSPLNLTRAPLAPVAPVSPVKPGIPITGIITLHP